MNAPSRWDPAQYERFKDERSRPFYDLAALVRPSPAMRVVDLGCGTGELTSKLHERLGARETVGVDSSETMLAKAADLAAVAAAGGAVRFEQGRIEDWAPKESVDLVFSNAALHWVDGHEELFAGFKRALAPGGQVAVQMPANEDHASHVVAAEVAREPPFREALAGFVRTSSNLALEEYAVLLHRLGFGETSVRMQVYGHALASREDVVEWVKGTLLHGVREADERRDVRALSAKVSRAALFERLEDARPFFYTYKRVFIWGR